MEESIKKFTFLVGIEIWRAKSQVNKRKETMTEGEMGRRIVGDFVQRRLFRRFLRAFNKYI